MARTIKITCNGAGKHVNEIDLDQIRQPAIVTRSVTPTQAREIPERSVFKCKFCNEGRVIITREMVQDASK